MEKYSSQEIEKQIYKKWETADCFSPDEKKSEKGYFSIVIPPPNVTGYLHIGHALVNSLQDIIVRIKRMQGFKTLWVPGTDHAGIATQMVVERDLLQKGIKKKEIGKKIFVQKIWEWRDKNGNKIYEQLKRLGASLDWKRKKFTLDEDLSKAVRKAFVKLYNEDLIYRAEYLVNWCPKDQTALSDLEVDHLEQMGEITQVRYPLIDSEDYIEVATTRPETILGDSAIAVHPDDERYKTLIGKQALVPLVQRKVTIIGDKIVDKNFGTGAVKITPAHDPNDFEIGKKHQLKFINIFTEDAKINEIYPPLQGLDRFVARKEIIKLLQKQKLWVSTKKHLHRVGHSQRSKAVIEPRLSTQWFCKMTEMASIALKELKKSNIQFYPNFQSKIFQEWLENIQDWCISRQLWWGHPIPAWRCKSCKKITVKEQTPKNCQHCNSKEIIPDTDVLDTWFSSGLFPFSVMGWPEKTKDFQNFYPNSLLITGYDILFFWVARMIMLGIKLTEKIPFPKVVLHGLVRDKNGEKMSKTKGNVVDPLEIIEQHGADALRFALCSLTIDSRDLKLPENTILQAKFFINKIWNATNFALYHLKNNNIITPKNFQEKIKKQIETSDPYNIEENTFDILHKLGSLTHQCQNNIEQYQFSAYAKSLYNFIWGQFCDWYIEKSKPMLFGKLGKHPQKSALYGITVALEDILKLLHPVCPFVTEYLWQKLPTTEGLLIKQKFPDWNNSPFQKFNPKNSQFNFQKDIKRLEIKAYDTLIKQIRIIKSENGLQPKNAISLFIKNKEIKEGEFNLASIKQKLPIFESLAGIQKVEFVDKLEKKEGFALGQFSYKTGDIFAQRDFMIDLNQKLDITAEKKRYFAILQKDQKRQEELTIKLQNPNFTEKAPAKLVKANQQEFIELKQKIARTKLQLQKLENEPREMV